MPAIKKFFSLDYYTYLLSGEKRFRSSLAAFLFALLLTLRPSLSIYKNILPVVKELENKVNSVIDEVFPSELEIKIKNGYASTNVTEPYYVTVSSKTFENLFSGKNNRATPASKLRILAIDTKGKADNFESYQSLALLTETSLIYYNDEKINISSLREVKNLTLNKELIKTKIQEVNQNNRVGKLINILVVILPLFILLGIFSGLLMTFLFSSILVWLLGKILQHKTSFKSAYGYTAAVLIIISCFKELLSLLPYLKIGAGFLSLFSNIILLGVAYLSLDQIKNRPAIVPPTVNPPTANPPAAGPPIPPVVNPPVTNPPVANTPAANPPVINSPIANPPVANPPAVNPPTTNPNPNI